METQAAAPERVFNKIKHYCAVATRYDKAHARPQTNCLPTLPRTGEGSSMKVNNVAKGAAATGGLALAGCAVCCAPLIVVPELGILAASGIGLAVAGQIGIAVLLGAGVGGYAWYHHRQRKRAASRACGCSSAGSCGASAAR